MKKKVAREVVVRAPRNDYQIKATDANHQIFIYLTLTDETEEEARKVFDQYKDSDMFKKRPLWLYRVDQKEITSFITRFDPFPDQWSPKET